MSKVTIGVTIINKKGDLHLTAAEGDRLRDVLSARGILPTLPCAGNAKCGKCRVRFLSGAPEPGKSDMELIPQKELSEGVRLLCRAVLEKDCRLEISFGDLPEEMEVLTLSDEESRIDIDCKDSKGDDASCIAIDLGTTTVAASLVEKRNGLIRVKDSRSTVNHQAGYGADVISRISSAEDKEAAAHMKSLIGRDILFLIKELIAQGGSNSAGALRPETIVISGNTTMLHLLTGKSVEGLGKYPYTPVSVSMESFDGSFLGSELEGVRIDVLPGISAFVGADIVSGIYELKEIGGESFLLLDLGTNGELAFYDGNRIKVASTAAGPVFEAGGISCGMASMRGAICSAWIEEDSSKQSGYKVRYATISDEKPLGICGTGLMELVSELVRVGVIDETGLFDDKFFEEGFPVTEDGRIRLTQSDIRNLQMAKAAVSSGVRTLLQGRLPERIFVSGGFGNAIDSEKIANLRMFPTDFNGRIIPAGNTALKGCVKYAAMLLRGDKEGRCAAEELKKIADMAEVTELAASEEFDEFYIEAMNF